MITVFYVCIQQRCTVLISSITFIFNWAPRYSSGHQPWHCNHCSLQNVWDTQEFINKQEYIFVVSETISFAFGQSEQINAFFKIITFFLSTPILLLRYCRLSHDSVLSECIRTSPEIISKLLRNAASNTMLTESRRHHRWIHQCWWHLGFIPVCNKPGLASESSLLCVFGKWIPNLWDPSEYLRLTLQKMQLDLFMTNGTHLVNCRPIFFSNTPQSSTNGPPSSLLRLPNLWNHYTAKIAFALL